MLYKYDKRHFWCLHGKVQWSYLSGSIFLPSLGVKTGCIHPYIIDYITFFPSDLCCQMTTGVVYRLGSKDFFPRVYFLLWGNRGGCRLVILQRTAEWPVFCSPVDRSEHRKPETPGIRLQCSHCHSTARGPRHQAKHPLSHQDQKTTAHTTQSLKKSAHTHTHTHTHAVIASGTALSIELL